MGIGRRPATWLLLIYTIPAEPSRKRALVWRALKKAGAISLRDGVWALPEREETVAVFRTIAAKVEELGGQATLVKGAQLDTERTEAMMTESRAARATEYRDVSGDAERFLEHVHRESEHREFGFADIEELEVDLDKLKRWNEQIRTRDYFGAAGSDQVRELLARCEESLSSFVEEAFNHREGTER